MYPVHTTPEEFQNGGFTLKTITCFNFVQTTYADVILKHNNYYVYRSKKLRFQNVFCPRGNEKPTFLNSLHFKNVLQKLRFVFATD